MNRLRSQPLRLEGIVMHFKSLIQIPNTVWYVDKFRGSAGLQIEQ